MTNNKEWLTDAAQIEPCAIFNCDGRKIYATHNGTVYAVKEVGYPVDKHERVIVLHEVLYVLNLV